MKCKRKVKLLGTTIDEKLTFTKHIANISSLANNKLRVLTRIRIFLSTRQAKYLSEAHIISAFKLRYYYCPLIWIFCNKTSNNQINKIRKRTMRLVNDMEDENLEDLLLKDNSWNVNENKIHTLLTEIYKSINTLRPPTMRDFYNKQLSKLPENNTSGYAIKLSALKVA